MAKQVTQGRWVVLLHRVSVALIAVAALVGLFAMHGLSADHMLNSSGAWASPTMPADMSSGATEYDAPGPAGAPQLQASPHDGPAMTMGGCVTALRGQTSVLQPCLLTTAARPAATPCSGGAAIRTAAARGPPQPTLTRLCISRT